MTIDGLLVRIRWPVGKTPSRHDDLGQRLALAFASLMTPLALLAILVGLWIVAAGRRWTDPFPISEGWLSYWQLWLGGGVVLRLAASWLNRHGHGSGR